MTPLTAPQAASDPGEPTQMWDRPDDLLADTHPRLVGPYVQAAEPLDPAGLPDPEPFPAPAPEPAPAGEAPVNDFAADFRELPFFRAVARIRGWCGFATRYLRRPAKPEAPPEPPAPPAPALFLSAYTADGELGGRVPLTGAPCYLGRATVADGRLFTWVRLGFAPSGGPFDLDIASAEALDDLIAELQTARDERPDSTGGDQ